MTSLSDSGTVKPSVGAGGYDGMPFVHVYRAYASVVRDFVLSHEPGIGRNDLSDRVHEVFLRLWENKGRFRGDSTLKTYILGIALNVLRE